MSKELGTCDLNQNHHVEDADKFRGRPCLNWRPLPPDQAGKVYVSATTTRRCRICNDCADRRRDEI